MQHRKVGIREAVQHPIDQRDFLHRETDTRPRTGQRPNEESEGDMQHVEVTRRFRAPVDQVWDAYTDHAGWKHWAGFSNSWLEKEGKPDKNGLGCVRGFGSNGINVFEEVVEWEPRKRFAYEIIRGGLPMKNHHGETIFAADGDGTLVTWRCRFDSRIPGLGWAMRKFVERLFRSGLDGLATKYFPDR